MKVFLGFRLMADKLHSLICPVKVWFSLRFTADTHNSLKKKNCVEVFGCGMFVQRQGETRCVTV